MSIQQIINEFQNYTYNKTEIISKYVKDLKNSGALDTNSLQIQEFLLPEIMLLMKKALVNRLSADLLFQNNYWSWGLVTLYYSNFFLSQSLNRLKGSFFIRLDGNIKNIKFNNGNYTLLSTSGTDSHKKELQELRSNYIFLAGGSLAENKFLNSLPDDYSINPHFNESTIRNDINYTLFYFQEFSTNEIKYEIKIDDCKKDYFFNNQVSLKEFKLLKINRSRFELLFHILKQIKETNTDFGIEYNKFMLEIEREITYKFKKETIRRVENYFNKNMKFNMISSVLIEELEGLIK